MNKRQAIAEVLDASGDTPTVFTTGDSCRIANGTCDKGSNFYMVGSMGLASCIAAGVAMTLAKPLIVVDGDGALAMNPGALMLAAQLPVLPLIHIVLDDGVYSSTGGQARPPVGDLESWAASLGYVVVRCGLAGGELREVVAGLLAAGITRPHLLRVAIEPNGPDVPGRIQGKLATHAARFRTHCVGLLASSAAVPAQP